MNVPTGEFQALTGRVETLEQSVLELSGTVGECFRMMSEVATYILGDRTAEAQPERHLYLVRGDAS